MIEFLTPHAPEGEFFPLPLKNSSFEGYPPSIERALRSKGLSLRTEEEGQARLGRHKGGEDLIFRSPYPGEIPQKGPVF